MLQAPDVCLTKTFIDYLFRKVRVVGYAAQICDKINPYSVLVEMHEENVEGSGMEDTGLVGVEWIHMPQDGVQWQALLSTMRKVICGFRKRGDLCSSGMLRSV